MKQEQYSDTGLELGKRIIFTFEVQTILFVKNTLHIK